MTVFEVDAPTRLGPESNGMHMTREEFDAVEAWDERFRYELVNGVVLVRPIPPATERVKSDVLNYLLRSFMERWPGVIDEALPTQEVETPAGVRLCDQVVWSGLGRIPRPTHDVPAIVVDFVSQSSRDRRRDYEEKRGEYAAIGVAEYWVIDRFDRTMTICHLDGRQEVVREGEVYQTPLLPGFELPLDRLLAASDRFDEPGESS